MLNRSASLAMSTCVLKALPGKLDIKRHSTCILYIHIITWQHITCRHIALKLNNDSCSITVHLRENSGKCKYSNILLSLNRCLATIYFLVSFKSIRFGVWSIPDRCLLTYFNQIYTTFICGWACTRSYLYFSCQGFYLFFLVLYSMFYVCFANMNRKGSVETV